MQREDETERRGGRLTRAALAMPVLLSLLTTAGCAEISEPVRQGNLRVEVTTTGVRADPDGYRLVIEGVASVRMQTTGSIRLYLAPRQYTMTLEGVATNCGEGSNPRRDVSVIADQEVTESFLISCSRPPEERPAIPLDPSRFGNVHVRVVTNGLDLDRDGYEVELRSDPDQELRYVERKAIADTGTVAVPQGSYRATLLGVADNCTTVPLPSNGAVLVGSDDVAITFSVVCLAIPPFQGIRVSIVTSGTDFDRDGFTIELSSDRDGNPVEFDKTRAVMVNDTVTVPTPPGAYLVSLAGIADNCTVYPPGAQNVYVQPEEIIPLGIVVICAARASP